MGTDKNQMIDCGMMQMPLEPGDVISLSMFCRDGYEAKMRMDGVEMPWLRNFSVKTKKKKVKKRCYQCKKSVKLRICSKCKSVRYCSRKCQKISWKSKHRHDCK